MLGLAGLVGSLLALLGQGPTVEINYGIFFDPYPPLGLAGFGYGFVIWLYGLAAFREALDEKLDLAQEAAAGLRTVPGIDVPWEPELSIVAFRLTKTEWADPELATAELLRRLNALRRFVLSSTVVDGRFTIRIAILSFRTHRERIEETIDAIRTETARMLQVE